MQVGELYSFYQAPSIGGEGDQRNGRSVRKTDLLFLLLPASIVSLHPTKHHVLGPATTSEVAIATRVKVLGIQVLPAKSMEAPRLGVLPGEDDRQPGGSGDGGETGDATHSN